MQSVFDYSNELLKFNEIIKVASWQIPFSIFSSMSLNIINTICSIASFYQVNLEVIEDNEISIENGFLNAMEDQNDEIKFDSSTILKKIHEACCIGRWILLIFYQYPKDLMNLISKLLDLLRNQNKIRNSFRLIIDFQNVEKKFVPKIFLNDQTLVYYMGEENLDEMEGFNDIWANILNDNILPNNICMRNESTNENFLPTLKSNFSNRFTLNNEVSEISIEEMKTQEDGEDIIENMKLLA